MKISTLDETIYNEYEKRFILNKINRGILKRKIATSVSEAKLNYSKLLTPVTCSQEYYIKYWTKHSLNQYLSSKNLQSLNLDNKNDELGTNLFSYFNVLPLETLNLINNELHSSKYEDRKKVLDNHNLNFEEINHCFQELILARINYSQKEGFDSYLNFSLERQNIPRSEYDHFTNNLESTINFCNNNLPKLKKLHSWFYGEYNLPCFYCIIEDFPFKNKEDVMSYIFEKSLLLKKFQRKIRFIEGEDIYMNYIKEEDIFEISLPSNLFIKHHAVYIIHEMSHIEDYLECFQNEIYPVDRGIYQSEKIAIEKSLKIIKNYDQLYKAYMGSILLSFRRTLFEIEIFKPNLTDFGELNATIFNKVFKLGMQRSNLLYLFDDRTIMSPMSSLKYSVAYSNLLTV